MVILTFVHTYPHLLATCIRNQMHIEQMLWSDTPFGLIWASWGGTRVEAWVPDVKGSGCAATPPEGGDQAESVLYNGLIHPLTRYSIRGAFWFQGEHNVVTHSSQSEYACAFGSMINQWRDAWTGIGDFPFHYVQLAPYTGYAKFAGHGDISTIRLAQADSQSKIGLDTSGMAVAIDLGDPLAPAGDVHSRHKNEVARRLALQAMHVMYAFQWGENVSNPVYPQKTPAPFPLHFSGPQLTGAAMATSMEAVLTFAKETAMGLFLNDTMGCAIHRGIGFAGQPIGGECCKAKDTFQLCTGDAAANTSTLVCVNATSVKLDGTAGTVKLEWAATPNAAAPTSVRYAYSNYPQCALYNSDKLPAGPFVVALAPSAATNESTTTTTTTTTQHLRIANAPPANTPPANTPPALTPPMGLNSWNAFHCNVDERKMRAMADALVSTGLQKAGFNYGESCGLCWREGFGVN